jgi:hypothetical protein
MRLLDALYCANFRSTRDVIFREESVRMGGPSEEDSGLSWYVGVGGEKFEAIMMSVRALPSGNDV